MQTTIQKHLSSRKKMKTVSDFCQNTGLRIRVQEKFFRNSRVRRKRHCLWTVLKTGKLCFRRMNAFLVTSAVC